MTDSRPQEYQISTFATFVEFRMALALWLHAAYEELEVLLDGVQAKGAIVPPVFEYEEEDEEWTEF